MLALAGAACLPGGAQAAFGINEFDAAFSDADGSPATQAGSHPFAFTTSLEMNLSGPEETDGSLRELFLDLPPGLVANTTAYPRCTELAFSELDEGVNACPLDTAVGILVSSFDEPDNRITSPVFNLVPHSGELMRLGFRVAGVENVFVDIGLSPEPPYEATLSVGDFPESIELFGVELQLWGVPSSTAHDSLRGICGAKGGGISCPVAALGPLLTLPTSCQGQQETFYEAISWEDDEHWGSASTPGFTGCHRLAFSPAVTALLTTEGADSSTGLDVSVGLVDEGLVFPEGLAQSQVRNLVAALPAGMTAGPSLTASSGGCSEADVEAETPESAPGDGCPASSKIGAAELESPLVDEPIDGTVYRATPNENLAGSAMALYVVLKNPDLGVVIAQPVALETDPETGQLLAVAEEMPQLPFGDLHLHLDDGKGGPLVSPPLCGKYTIEAEFDPWAGEGTFRTLNPFQISSGPNGGPCPTGAHKGQAESSQAESGTPAPPPSGSPPAASEPAAPNRHVAHKHRCRRGKHRVRRHGKARCVKGRHRHKTPAR